jgi:hypothetical protein
MKSIITKAYRLIYSLKNGIGHLNVTLVCRTYITQQHGMQRRLEFLAIHM